MARSPNVDSVDELRRKDQERDRNSSEDRRRSRGDNRRLGSSEKRSPVKSKARDNSSDTGRDNRRRREEKSSRKNKGSDDESRGEKGGGGGDKQKKDRPEKDRREKDRRKRMQRSSDESDGDREPGSSSPDKMEKDDRDRKGRPKQSSPRRRSRSGDRSKKRTVSLGDRHKQSESPHSWESSRRQGRRHRDDSRDQSRNRSKERRRSRNRSRDRRRGRRYSSMSSDRSTLSYNGRRNRGGRDRSHGRSRGDRGNDDRMFDGPPKFDKGHRSPVPAPSNQQQWNTWAGSDRGGQRPTVDRNGQTYEGYRRPHMGQDGRRDHQGDDWENAGFRSGRGRHDGEVIFDRHRDVGGYSNHRDYEPSGPGLKRRTTMDLVNKIDVPSYHEGDLPSAIFNIYVPQKEMPQAEAEAYLDRVGVEVEWSEGSPPPNPVENIDVAGFHPDIRQQFNYDIIFPSQATTWPIALSGRDMIVIAETGTGKTLAFVLPLIAHCMRQPAPKPGGGPLAFILCPTRELVAQTEENILRFTTRLTTPRLNCLKVYGNGPINEQARQLRNVVHIVVGTMGRVLHLLSSRELTLRNVSFFVVDEIDRLIEKDADTTTILKLKSCMRPDKQTLCFSATSLTVDLDFMREHLVKRDHVTVRTKEHMGMMFGAVLEIKPHFIFMDNEDVSTKEKLKSSKRYEKFIKSLKLQLAKKPAWKYLVFCNKVETATWMYEFVQAELSEHPTTIGLIHGRLETKDRKSEIESFRKDGTGCILICSDVLARGMDFMVHCVFNFDFPRERISEYVQRIGRAGRARKRGIAVSFLTRSDVENMGEHLIKLLLMNDQPVPKELSNFIPSVREKYGIPVPQVTEDQENAEEINDDGWVDDKPHWRATDKKIGMNTESTTNSSPLTKSEHQVAGNTSSQSPSDQKSTVEIERSDESDDGPKKVEEKEEEEKEEKEQEEKNMIGGHVENHEEDDSAQGADDDLDVVEAMSDD